MVIAVAAGSNPGKGRFFRIKMKDETFELLRCSYSHIWWFAISKDSNPAQTQVRIPLGTRISIARDYENNLTAIQIAGLAAYDIKLSEGFQHN